MAIVIQERRSIGKAIVIGVTLLIVISIAFVAAAQLSAMALMLFMVVVVVNCANLFPSPYSMICFYGMAVGFPLLISILSVVVFASIYRKQYHMFVKAIACGVMLGIVTGLLPCLIVMIIGF